MEISCAAQTTMSPEEKSTGAEYWRHRWANHIIPFHRPSLHPYLREFGDHFRTSKKELRVFFPMCGKMREMKWFYEIGHAVIGVEITRQAIDEFFSENNLTATESYCSTTKCNILQTLDKRLTVYCCDVFDFMHSKPSLMDVVFDRASLCIMESQVDRQRYAKLMKSVLAPAYTYVLITFKHDDQSYKGVPRNVSDCHVTELFGENTTLKKLSELQEITVPGIKSPVIEVTWLMTG
ncbi:thiopurine S-methyltransferase isoform X2 [Dermacentor silvarum]|uniref:thiopurine S-methyltransferase isoform X2 n=1 Tax=Dermacentor silvarum TaxID=543639 RepID=UPI0021014DB0|nr:thiopurine S-methyltransferase isoform X2 [Dermacentor silvarum]